MTNLPRRFALATLLALLAACSSTPVDTDAGPTTDAPSGADGGTDVQPPRDVPPGTDVATSIDVPVGEDTIEADTSTEPDAPVGTDGATPGADYSVAGPLTPRNLARVTATLPTSTGCSGNQCNVAIDVSLPTAPADGRTPPYPLVILSNGFQVTDDQYASYATRFASWGYAVVRWNTTGESLLSSLGHDTLGHMVAALIDWARAENTRAGSMLNGLVATDHVLTIGHSRGGKASVLAAVYDPRVAAVVGIDPVNSMGVDALSLLRAARPIPLAVIGSGLGGMATFGMACAPTDGNYAQFYGAAMSPAFQSVVLQAGHMQFLDNRSTCGLACAVCPNGSAMDAAVRSFTQTVAVAWAERFLRGADTTRYTTASGTWVAGEVARMFVSATSR